MRFIGDVHGKFRSYIDLIREVDDITVQVGDMGIGFSDVPNFVDLFNRDIHNGAGNYFIRGNHDNPEMCKEINGFLPDGVVETYYPINIKVTLMYIGGAESIDRNMRIEGVDWWRDEEINAKLADDLIDKYEKVKPDILVTHDCPRFFVHDEMENHSMFKGSRFPSSFTQTFLQALYEYHKPYIHIFGHWHTSVRKKHLGTEFICLAELETLDMEI